MLQLVGGGGWVHGSGGGGGGGLGYVPCFRDFDVCSICMEVG